MDFVIAMSAKNLSRQEVDRPRKDRSRSTEIFGTADANDSYKSVVDLSEDEQEKRTTSWPDTPPPLPPRLRHLPPVHMNLEDRHKVASRSLPPPPPYHHEASRIRQIRR